MWQETCVQAFCSSCPTAELDACLWSLTEVLKKLLKGSSPGLRFNEFLGSNFKTPTGMKPNFGCLAV